MLEQPAFGRRLRQLRQQRGLTQTALAGPDVSAAYISRLESGSRPPTERVLRELAVKLDVSLSAFEEIEMSSLLDVVTTTLVLSDADMSLSLQDQIEKALSRSDNPESALRWQAYAQLARLKGKAGDREGERLSLRQLVEVSRELGYPVLRVHACFRLARCERSLGDVNAARATAREGLRIAADAGLRTPDAVRLRLLLASVVTELGDLAEALRISDDVCDQLRDERGPLAAEALWTAATVSTRHGNHARASELLDRAMAVLDSRDNLTLWMRLRLAASALALQASPPRADDAEAHLDTVKPALDLVGHPQHLQEYVFLRAQLAFVRGDHATAEALCAEAAGSGDLLNFRDRVRLRMLQGQIRVLRGDPDALGDLGALAEEARSTGMLDLAAEVWRAAAETRA
ncbi:helix-turn-helix domain-containing protein [Streptomyces sp. NPDC012825]|uniref:helix-turn-helix domain-containing protein n=1 Tax=Streptomyces sp. NPDC012825 TaxID=3364851 RepID=UPI0036ABC232